MLSYFESATAFRLFLNTIDKRFVDVGAVQVKLMNAENVLGRCIRYNWWLED